MAPPNMDALTKVFREVFEDDAIELTPQTVAQDIPAWDSFTHIVLITSIERTFGVRFTGDEVQSTNSIGEFLSLLQRKAGGA